jgi:hypothetical protein
VFGWIKRKLMRIFELLFDDDVVAHAINTKETPLNQQEHILSTKLPLLVQIWLMPNSKGHAKIGEVRYELINEVFTTSLIDWRKSGMSLNLSKHSDGNQVNSLVQRIADTNENQWAATAKTAIQYNRQQDFLEMFYNYYILARPKGAIEEFGEVLIQEISDLMSELLH